jgi:tRNA/rRNA methyltransferase/tRNA (cytidine32/uridine32-2'-O)-methyltransferase
VAQACLLALYELHLLAGDATKRLPPPRHAAGTPTSEAVERAFADLEAALEGIAYFGTRNRELVMRSVRSLLFRAEPDARELLMLRTMSIEVLRTIERESRLAVRAALAAAGLDSSPPPALATATQTPDGGTDAPETPG